MPHNIESMAYVGHTPWHGLGTKVPTGIRAANMIVAAGLDWEVEKRPARGAKPLHESNKGPTYARYENVRLPRNQSEEEIVLGLVSKRYVPLQNEEAFAFFDPIVDQRTATFETAGALGDGERVWVLAKMPEAMQIVRGDECQKYLLLSNSHTGQGSVIVKFTAVRVVCQNTLMLAMEDGQQAFRVRHSKAMSQRLHEIGNLIAAANTAFAKAAELFRAMAACRVSEEILGTYLEAVFPRTAAQRAANTRPPKWVHVERVLAELPDLQLAPVRGTLWAAYNAITHFEDYREAPRESDGGRLNRVWFGSGAQVKLKALLAAARMVGHN